MAIPIEAPGVGPLDAKIVLVGESLGAEEKARHLPFVGSAGRLLDSMLAATRLRRDDIYITNLVKVQPPGNDLDRLGELGLSVADYVPLLKEELERIQPNLIVSLGGPSTEHLTGRKGITKWRGSVLPCTLVPGLKVMPTLHPAYVLRDFSMHPVVLKDLEKAKRESAQRALEAPQLTLTTQPTLFAVMEYIDRCAASGAFSYDIETLGPRIRCLGLSCSPESALCIPLKHGMRNHWTENEEQTVWLALKQLFQTPGVVKVAQNAVFDLSYLVPFVGFPVPPLFDTMLAHHLLYPELPHDLDFLASIYTPLNYYGIGAVMRATDEDTHIYNMKDCLATYMTWQALSQELTTHALDQFYADYVMVLFECLFEMQHRGVLIDVDGRGRVVEQLKNEIANLEGEVNDLAGHDLNANSPKQLQDYFYRERGYASRLHRKRGTTTVDRDALAKIAAQGDETAAKILELRTRQKLVSTFLDVPTDSGGRLHCEYVISGTVTGRLSSRAPLSGEGTNLQNIPPQARTTFIPTPGKVFVKGDLKQAENMVVAWLTKGRMQQAFRDGKDVHELTARLMGTERKIGKVCNHAGNYGMGPGQLAALLKVPLARARELLESYHRAYPEVREWHRRIQDQLRKDRTLVTPLGRRRQFLGRWSDELFRGAYAFIPQSTVADYLNQGLVELWLRLKLLDGAYPLLQVHDEVVTECWPHQVTEVQHLYHRCLEQPFDCEGEELTIPVELKVLLMNWLE